VDDGDPLHWTTIGLGRIGVRGFDTPKRFTPEICGGLYLRSSKAEVPSGRQPLI
jgi:hypothetical protein